MISEGVSSMLRHSVRVCLQFQGYLDTVFRVLVEAAQLNTTIDSVSHVNIM